MNFRCEYKAGLTEVEKIKQITKILRKALKVLCSAVSTRDTIYVISSLKSLQHTMNKVFRYLLSLGVFIPQRAAKLKIENNFKVPLSIQNNLL